MTSSPASGAVMITSLAAGGNIHLDMERFLSFSTLGRPGPVALGRSRPLRPSGRRGTGASPAVRPI